MKNSLTFLLAMALLPASASAESIRLTLDASSAGSATTSVVTVIAANDAAWRQGLLGTWQAVDSPTATTVNGEGSFTADGKASGYTTATYVYNDGYTSDVKVGLKFKWKINNGVITLDNFVSDPAQFIKPTQVKRFQILSMSNAGMSLKDLADGEEVYRRRKLD